MFTDTNNRHTRRFHRRISNQIHISIYKREGSQHKLRGLGNKILSARKTKYERSEFLMRALAVNEILLKKEKAAGQRAVKGRPKAFGKCSSSKSFSSLHKMDMMSKR